MRLMGVDFGTCYSSVCFKNGDEIKALKPRTEQKAERIPSVFYHEKQDPRRDAGCEKGQEKSRLYGGVY